MGNMLVYFAHKSNLSAIMYRPTLMYNLSSQVKGPCMMIDRVIDGPQQIYVGVTGNVNNNPLSGQCMRSGGPTQPLRRLTHFVENDNTLEYYFENDTHMKFMKRDNGEVILNLRENNQDTFITISDTIKKIWKPISHNSLEIDKLGKFFN